jgi:hypothetical protein
MNETEPSIDWSVAAIFLWEEEPRLQTEFHDAAAFLRWAFAEVERLIQSLEAAHG